MKVVCTALLLLACVQGSLGVASVGNRCGTSWPDACSRCIKCQGGTESECPDGTGCYAGFAECTEASTTPTTPTTPSSSTINLCGASWEDAKSQCIKCPGGLESECPGDSGCYAGLPDCTEKTPPETTTPEPTIPSTGGTCSPATGLAAAPGECGSFSACRDDGGTPVSGLCPGGFDNQCCVPRRCRTSSGTGYCMPEASCSGTTVSGTCVGSNSRCCVDIDPPRPSATCGSLTNPHASASRKACGKFCSNPRITWIEEKIECAFPAKFTCSTHGGGDDSDHPGNAADCTPNAIGTCSTGQDKTDGDSLALWLIENASSMQVKYLVWYDQIWSVAHAGEGWRDYTPNPKDCIDDPTNHCTSGEIARCGHYDHVHISVY